MSDRPIFFDESRLRWRLLRPVLIACVTGSLIIPVILTLSILNVEVLPQLKPQQAIAARGNRISLGEGTRPANLTSPDSGKEGVAARSGMSFSERWFGGQEKQAATAQSPVKWSEHIRPELPDHTATMVTSFTE
jgi:hypothetical protein